MDEEQIARDAQEEIEPDTSQHGSGNSWSPTSEYDRGQLLGAATERLRVYEEVKRAHESGTLDKWLERERPRVWTGRDEE